MISDKEFLKKLCTVYLKAYGDLEELSEKLDGAIEIVDSLKSDLNLALAVTKHDLWGQELDEHEQSIYTLTEKEQVALDNFRSQAEGQK